MAVIAPAPTALPSEQPQGRLQLRMMPMADLDRAGERVVRVDMVAVDDAVAGADGVAEQFSDAASSAGQRPPLREAVDTGIHDVSRISRYHPRRTERIAGRDRKRLGRLAARLAAPPQPPGRRLIEGVAVDRCQRPEALAALDDAAQVDARVHATYRSSHASAFSMLPSFPSRYSMKSYRSVSIT